MLILGGCCLFQLSGVQARELAIPSLHPFIDNGAYALNVQGKTLRSYNLNRPFIPASTIKLLTGLMALDTLGPQFRFTTTFYSDDANNLYIKGKGDPFLTSEAITQIAQELKKLGVKDINTLIFDNSAFALEKLPSQSAHSDNPYDAPSAALAVNFNTLPFIVTRDKKVISGEKQTPLLPLMENLASSYPEGSHRINVSILPPVKDHSNTVRYCGELFTAIFKKHGITVINGFSAGRVSQNAMRLMVYKSGKTTTDLVRLCLEYSNNFIANQLYLTCGGKIYGYPATWKKAEMAAARYIEQKLHLTGAQVRLVDGSGLSIQNRITAEAMLLVLENFRPYAKLLPREHSTYIKSGTLTGVYSYVGYFSHSRELSPFVLFLNQKKNSRNTVLQLLEKEHTSLSKQP
jgi:D-alanyl-D-alanine carboxypeptidase/D-alanyl-D-alanine-endopeptidase (penicillin-binding protein 4)